MIRGMTMVNKGGRLIVWVVWFPVFRKLHTGYDMLEKKEKGVMAKTKLILGVVLVLALVSANAWQYWLKPAPLAPDVSFTTLNGDQLSLQALKGKPVFISFWTTSCGLCLSEIDDLIAVHNHYQAKGYTTLAVALSYDSLPQVRTMTAGKPLPYTVIYDQKGEFAKAFGGVRMTPTHFLISPDGYIVWRNVGPIDREALQSRLDALVS